MSDDELLEAIKQRDGEALSELYDRYAVTVNRIVRRLIADEQKVQDVTQDVFTRIWTSAAGHYRRGCFQNWLYVVTRRIAVDYLRKERRQPQVLVPDSELDLHLVAGQTTEVAVGQELLKTELLEIVSSLPSDQQTVLKLAYFRGYTLNEIAQLLDMPVGTVKTRLHRGLKGLRLMMGDWESEVGKG